MISNKSFIHSPVKEKAKTNKLSFGRISESDGDISVQGLLIKQRCTKPKCWHEICYMGKVSTSYLQYYNHAKYCTISTKNELPRGKPRSIGAKTIGVAHDAAFYIPLFCLGSEYIFVLPFHCPFCRRC